MDWFTIFLTLTGLALFEVIISVDNAIINAEVLSTMSRRARQWFLIWGIFIAVFLVRGLLPWLILWMSSPSLGFIGSFTASFSSDPVIVEIIRQSAPILLIGGGTFLVLLFLHWIFLEPKHYGLMGEDFMHKQGVWFYAAASIFLTGIVWFAIGRNPLMAFSAVVGSTVFFITHGFKENAEQAEKELIAGAKGKSDISKILYLEVIDATFSIDGILGAFAFTFAIPLILIGNGIGALCVRQFTVKNIKTVKKYKYLKNGAMYSIFALGIIMISESFGAHIPEWVSPVMTFAIIGYFFFKSRKELRKEQLIKNFFKPL